MRGEVKFEALGKSYIIYLGTAAQCAIEEEFDRGYFAVVAEAVPDLSPEDAYAMAVAMSNGTIPAAPVAQRATQAMRNVRKKTLRSLAYHGLQKHHPTITIDEVNSIIDDLTDDPFGEIMGRALRGAQGEPSSEEAGEDATPGKPKPNRSTGKRKRTGAA